MERISTLFKSKKQLYAEGSPVIIVARAILKDNENDEVLAQLKFKNISEKAISAIRISIKAFDVYGEELAGVEGYQYLDLSIKRNEEFGHKQAIHFSNNNTRQFSISSMEVVFEDSSVIKTNGAVIWEEIPDADLLEAVLPAELAEQYRRDTFTDAKYSVAEYKDLWICSCGNVNKKEESICFECKNSREKLLLALNEDTLKENYSIFEKEKAEKEAELKKIKEQKAIENKKQTQKFLKIAIIATIICALILIIVILITKVFMPLMGS